MGDLGFPIGSTAEDVHHRHRPRTRLAGQRSVPAPAAGPNANQAHIFEPNVYHDACLRPTLASPQRRDHGGPVGLPGRDSSSRQHRLRRVDDRPRWLRGPEDDDQDGTPGRRWRSHATGPVEPGPGSGSVPLLTLANSYTLRLAADGKVLRHQPDRPHRDGQTAKDQTPATKCKQVISPDARAGATGIAQGVIQYGTGTAAGYRPTRCRQDRNPRGPPAVVVRRLHPQLATAVYVGTPITSHTR